MEGKLSYFVFEFELRELSGVSLLENYVFNEFKNLID